MSYNDPRLPGPLLSKLAEKGYEVEDVPPLDLGAEKFIFGAKLNGDQGAVVMYSKMAGSGVWAWKYQRELEVLQDLKASGKEHQHIIRMLDFIPPTKDHGPCMIEERVEPLGFDMFKVVKQYQGAERRTLPVAQWMHYFGQLLEAVEHLHERGWVHCDLKPDNVMVQNGHDIKVIDFGYSRRAGQENCPGLIALYVPPEFSNVKMRVNKSADLWLIGAMMFVVFAQMQVAFRTGDGKLFEVTNHSHAKKHGVVAAIREWWGKKVDPVMGEVIDNLLRRDPLERWTLPRLRSWWQTVKGDLDREVLLPIVPNAAVEPSKYFCKAPQLEFVKAFGLQATPEDFAGKYIGSHTTDSGQVIEGEAVIDFRKDWDAQVLFIDRGTEVINVPRARDRLRKGDWVYYLLMEQGPPETEEEKEMYQKAQQAREIGVEIWLEFDWFAFPEHVYGASIMDIGLGKLFGINVQFIARVMEMDETAGEAEGCGSHLMALGEHQETTTLTFLHVEGTTVIEPGDRALVCRVPDRTTGRSHSILTDAILSPFLEESSFLAKLSEDEALFAKFKAKP